MRPSHAGVHCAERIDVLVSRTVSQSVNPLPQMINQQSRANGQAVTMSPRHLDHFELRTETPPRPARRVCGNPLRDGARELKSGKQAITNLCCARKSNH
jgi:hypothetical protein